jgi:hypothetical protein
MRVMNAASLTSPEVMLAEQELLRSVLISDAETMHDTLTFQDSLFSDPAKFYALGEMIAGSNFLKTPHKIKPPSIENLGMLESESPPWMEMQQANSLAKWILYFIERALFV